MLKGNTFILFFSVLIFLTILLVSSTKITIKALLTIMAVAFLFPVIRKTLFKDKFRKIKVAFYSSLTFTIGFFLITIVISIFEGQAFHLDGDFIGFFIVILLFSLIGNFSYGLPVSLIAEFISMKLFKIRFWLSGFIHIGCGWLTYFLFPGFFIPAIICSVIFFVLDEITRKKFDSL